MLTQYCLSAGTLELHNTKKYQKSAIFTRTYLPLRYAHRGVRLIILLENVQARWMEANR